MKSPKSFQGNETVKMEKLKLKTNKHKKLKMRILKSAVQSLPAPFMSMSLPDTNTKRTDSRITTHEPATATHMRRRCIAYSSRGYYW
jgi:hypothetical protein